MKKVLMRAMALALALLMCMAPSLAEEQEKSICGTYYGYRAVVDGDEMHYFMPGGYNALMILREDGTGYFKMYEVNLDGPSKHYELPFTWTAIEENGVEIYRQDNGGRIGSFYRDGETGGLTVTGANFLENIAEDAPAEMLGEPSNGDQFKFSRFPVDIVEIDTQAQPEDFDGLWQHVAYLSIYTFQTPEYHMEAPPFGYYMTIDTQNGVSRPIYSDGSGTERRITSCEDGILKTRYSYTYGGDYTMYYKDEWQLMTNGVLVNTTYETSPEYFVRVDEMETPVEYTDKATVKKVQQALNDNGYACGTADGIAGKKTYAALENYQADHDLKVTGTITHETLVSLELAD